MSKTKQKEPPSPFPTIEYRYEECKCAEKFAERVRSVAAHVIEKTGFALLLGGLVYVGGFVVYCWVRAFTGKVKWEDPNAEVIAPVVLILSGAAVACFVLFWAWCGLVALWDWAQENK